MTIPFSLPPIIERELRVASRRSATYWGRVGSAVSGICVFFWVMTTQLATASPATAGLNTFRFLAGIAAFAAVTSVLQLSAEAFAREKREDTLGLLFLTPLRPIDLVLGKLTSSSLLAFCRFVAIVPLLALPMLVGGVTVLNFLLLVLALINLVFLGATLGLYISARTWDEKRAATIATVTMLGLAVLLPALGVGLAAAVRWPGAVSFLALSPAFPIWQATVPGAAGSWSFWASLLLTQIAGWMLFRATCRTLPLCWQKRPAKTVLMPEQLRRRFAKEATQHLAVALAARTPAAAGAIEARQTVRQQFDTRHRAQMLDQNPVLWLALRWRSDSTRAWIIGSVGLVGFVVAAMMGRPEAILSPGLALFVSFCANAALKCWAGTQASVAFARDHGEDTLALLLSTPITPAQLMDGHRLALRETLRPSIQRTLWIEAVWMTFAITIHALNGGRETGIYVLASLALLGLLIPDLYAVGWTALRQGVLARNARDAEREAFMQVLILPWILAFFGTVLALVLSGLRGGVISFILTWGFFSAVADWWFARRSRRRLPAELTLWALRRSAGELERHDGWRRAGRWLGRWWKSAKRPFA